jgi:hypothetical protein
VALLKHDLFNKALTASFELHRTAQTLDATHAESTHARLGIEHIFVG